MFTKFYCSVVVSLLVYMEVVPKPITLSDHIKAFLDDSQWPEHIKDPQLKQIREANFFEHTIILNFF